MSIVKSSHRALYIEEDKSSESKETINFLCQLGVDFAIVQLKDIKTNQRRFTKLPTLTYVTRGGYFVTLQGLEEIKSAKNGILSDFKTEKLEKEKIKKGLIPEWEPV